MSGRPGSAAERAAGGRDRWGRVRRVLAIRAGEERLIGAVASAFAALEAGRGFGEVGIDAVILDRFGVGILPALYLALGATGIVATLVVAALLGAARDGRVFLAVPLVLAAVLAGGRLAAVGGASEVLPVLWVAVWLSGLLLLTLLWTVATRVFDARQAKRLFPVCTSAAIGGSFVGLLLAGPAARLLGTENLVLLEALLVGAAAMALARISPRLTPARSTARRSPVAALRDGAGYVGRSPLMRLVAVAYLLFAVLLFAMSFPFNGAMAEAFQGDPAGLASALGLLAAAVTATSFVVSTFAANRLYARFGVATVAMLLPIVYVAGFGIWLLAFGLPAAVAVRFTQQVVQRGMSNAAWSAFFSVVPSVRRSQVLAFMDAVPGHLGTVLSGLLLIAATSLPLATGFTPVFVVGLVAGVLCLAVVAGIRSRYAASIVATLRGGLAEQVLEGGPGLSAFTRDPRVVAALCATTSSERPAERRLAADLLGQTGGAEAERHLVRLLDDEEPDVRLAAVASLSAVSSGYGDQLRGRLADEDARVRAAAVGVLGRRGAIAELASAEEDPDPGVRSELAVALARAGEASRAKRLVTELLAGGDEPGRLAALAAVSRSNLALEDIGLIGLAASPSAPVRAAALDVLGRTLDPSAPVPPQADEALTAGLDDDDAAVRAAAGRALARVPAGSEIALSVLRTGPGRAQAAALDALDGDDPAIRERVTEWARAEVDRAARYRRDAAALARAAADPTPYLHVPDGADGAGGGRASAAFLATILARRGVAIEDRLLQAVAALGAPEATGLIRRCLRSADPETRAQAIEALDALGDARLARAIVALLDSEADPGTAPATVIPSVASALVDDGDSWVRAMALRTLAAYLDDARRAVEQRAQADPDPSVAGAVADLVDGGRPVPDSRATLGELDRMLLLRRVPLFEMLEPEDLQRLATVATERVYAGGEDLVVEGDLGDELVVIVDGRVRVVRRDGDGERLIREYAAGDHIGELAVLREGQRAATVRAEEPGVRGLVIGGAAVKSILRERPEAAMAMLATLAERLSRQ